MEIQGKNLIQKLNKAGLKTPETLTLMITGACNLKCPHCLLNCGNINVEPVQKEAILKIADEFSEIGGETLIITGGEPLSHPEWYDILKHVCDSTGLNEITLQTNGAMVTEKDVKKLKTLSPEKLTIQLSIDGATSAVNDLIRGHGHFDRCMRVLGLFAEVGMEKRIKIAFTEMKHNFHEIPQLLKLGNDYGIGQIITGTLVKSGRAINIDWIELPARSQVRDLIERYESDLLFRKLYNKLGNISAIEWFKGRDTPLDHVCNCISTPFINANGKMYPCIMFLADNLSVDDVFEQGLKKGILLGLEMWLKLPEIDKKRNISLEKCQDCKGRNHCRGGCMGRAQSVSGEIMSTEDRCALRREVYCF